MVKGHFRGHWIQRDRCYYLKDHCINYDLIVPPECSIGIYAYKRED
mgnify:CR=1 FL=1